MKPENISMSALYAFMAGRHEAWRDQAIKDARRVDYPDEKKMYVAFAREHNRRLMEYLRMAKRYS